MTRQRMTDEQAAAAIRSVLQAAPDRKLTHRQLIAALAAAGNDGAVAFIPRLCQNKTFISLVDAVENGRPAMTVTLPAGG